MISEIFGVISGGGGSKHSLIKTKAQEGDAKRHELLTPNADDGPMDGKTPADTKTQISSCSKNDSQHENTRPCKLVDLLGSESKEPKSILEDVQTKNQLLEEQLAQALESDHAMGKKLRKAYEDAEYYIQQMHRLNYALEQEPGKYADINREIDLRDQRCSDLMIKWGSCSDELVELEKKSAEDKQAAHAEVAFLKAEVKKYEHKMEDLEAAKETFQRQSEDVYDMLARRIVPSALFDAMNEYFHLVIKDNDLLKATIKEQTLEISTDRDQIKLLRFENQNLKERALFEKKIQAELGDKIRAQDNEIGGLELKLDSVAKKQVHVVKSKDSVIANMQADIDEYLDEITILRGTNERDSERLDQSQTHVIVGLRSDLDHLWARICELEHNEEARKAEAEFTAFAVCRSEIESDQLKIRLETANEELKKLRRKVQQSEIPQPGCDAAAVLLEGALGKAYVKIQKLKDDLSDMRSQSFRHSSKDDLDIKGKGKQRQHTGEGPSSIP